ncbi:MAG: DUF503 domain-containing protein [Candidatus Krumholzibacteriia bacterium]|nr:DUF503 domain-containing protein [Candidatus Latescibacterota bacterium]
MRVLVLTLELGIPGCRSLKARRAVLERLKARLRRDLNLSVSEVEPTGIHDRARLGVAAVVASRAQGDAQLEKVLAILEREPRVVLLEEEKEYW